MAVLDISKTLMYDFHYNTIKHKYQDKAQLLFTDTDSLCYHIKTDDLNSDRREKQKIWKNMTHLIIRKIIPYTRVNSKKKLGNSKMKQEVYP